MNPIILSFTPAEAQPEFRSGQSMSIGFLVFSRDSNNRKVPYDLTGFTYEVLDQDDVAFSPALTASAASPTNGVVTLSVPSAVSPSIVDDSEAFVWAINGSERYCIGKVHFDKQV